MRTSPRAGMPPPPAGWRPGIGFQAGAHLSAVFLRSEGVRILLGRIARPPSRRFASFVVGVEEWAAGKGTELPPSSAYVGVPAVAPPAAGPERQLDLLRPAVVARSATDTAIYPPPPPPLAAADDSDFAEVELAPTRQAVAEVAGADEGTRTFNFEGVPIRVVLRDGKPWFVASDVCWELGLRDVSDAVAKLDDDEKGRGLIPTPGGRQQLLVVSESGFNAIILRCNDAMKPGSRAHRVRRWVTGEVLPAIARTGSYGAPPPLSDEDIMAKTFLLANSRVKALEADKGRLAELLVESSARVEAANVRADVAAAENAILAPKAAKRDQIAGAGGQGLRANNCASH